MPKHDELTSEPSLPGFVAWLRSKDPNEHYEWTNWRICACGQYSREVLEREDWLGESSHPVWPQLNDLARGDRSGQDHEKVWTFGKCLERAERELEKA